VNYLTIKQVILIHSIIINETGGAHGIRDHDAILILKDLPRQKVFGRELYKSIFSKAAVYARNIITAHPFIDGNKRTAMVSASVFLENNGYKITSKKGGVEKFALEIIIKKLDLRIIAKWFKNNSRKIKK